jgi:class 3 adenylate cyclase
VPRQPKPSEEVPKSVDLARKDQLDEQRKTFEVQPVRHVFVDVVEFSENRSVEAQCEIVFNLNEIFRSAAQSLEDIGEVIYLPTGDGICASFLYHQAFDIHLRFALTILRLLADYNEQQSDNMRRFQIRVGLNQNLDNIVQDINDRKNVAGAGITLAQRIMGLADGGQILAGEAVYHTVRYREAYMQAFKPFRGVVKHGVEIPVYQVIIPNQRGLNTDVPSAFRGSGEKQA